MNRLLIAGLVVSALFFPMDAAALDGKRMMDVIETLASDDYEGRGIGTTGLSKAADYIAARFEAAGLKPGGEFGYFQTFSVDGPDGKPVRVKNVVGVIPGVLRPVFVPVPRFLCTVLVPQPIHLRARGPHASHGREVVGDAPTAPRASALLFFAR